MVQLLIQLWLSFVAAFIYYGFSFSWGSLGNNIYISYLCAAIGEVIAYTVLTFPLEYWGRKYSHCMMFFVGKNQAAHFCLLRQCYCYSVLPRNVSIS